MKHPGVTSKTKFIVPEHVANGFPPVLRNAIHDFRFRIESESLNTEGPEIIKHPLTKARRHDFITL